MMVCAQYWYAWQGMPVLISQHLTISGDPSVYLCLGVGDVFTLAKLMGHTSIAVLQRYLKQTMDDTKEAHRRASPVEGWRL